MPQPPLRWRLFLFLNYIHINDLYYSNFYEYLEDSAIKLIEKDNLKSIGGRPMKVQKVNYLTFMYLSLLKAIFALISIKIWHFFAILHIYGFLHDSPVFCTQIIKNRSFSHFLLHTIIRSNSSQNTHVHQSFPSKYTIVLYFLYY